MGFFSWLFNEPKEEKTSLPPSASPQSPKTMRSSSPPGVPQQVFRLGEGVPGGASFTLPEAVKKQISYGEDKPKKKPYEELFDIGKKAVENVLSLPKELLPNITHISEIKRLPNGSWEYTQPKEERKPANIAFGASSLGVLSGLGDAAAGMATQYVDNLFEKWLSPSARGLQNIGKKEEAKKITELRKQAVDGTQKMFQTFTDILDETQKKEVAKLPPEWQEGDKKKLWEENKLGAYVFSNVAPFMGAVMAAAPLGPLGQEAVGAAIFGGQSRREARESGANVADQNKVALLNGAIGAVTAVGPLQGIFKSNPELKESFVSTLGRVAKTMVKMPSLGAAQQLASNQVARWYFDNKRDIYQGVAENAALMGLLGVAGEGARLFSKSGVKLNEPGLTIKYVGEEPKEGGLFGGKIKEGVVSHGTTPEALTQIKKEGMKPSERGIFGKGAYFTSGDETLKTYGKDVVTIKPSDFNLKRFETKEEQMNFLKKNGFSKISETAEAIQKDGTYDGFIIPNENKGVGDTHVLTNFEKLNQKVIETPIKKKADTKKTSPLDLYQARQENLKKMREAMKSEVGEKIASEAEFVKEKKAQLDERISQGIKNSAYYKKEGEIKDEMGRGYLMEKGNKYVVADPESVPKYTKLGYTKKIEIDSLAHEAGFETGQEYLQHHLDISKEKSVDVKKEVARTLEKIDEHYRQNQKMLESLKDMEPFEKKYTLMKGARDLEKIRNRMREGRVKAMQEYHGLTGSEMRKIGRKDLRTMTENEFNTYLKNLDDAMFEAQKNRQVKNELLDLIKTKELKKTDNLRKAMELPTVDKMSEEQLRIFANALEQYQTGDTFLSPRTLETIDRTSVEGAKTWREVETKMAEEFNVPISELKEGAILPSEFTKFLYDSALAEKHPFYSWLVGEVNRADLEKNASYLPLSKKVDELASKSRKSEKRTTLEKAVPTDEKVVEWLESPNKSEVAKTMTKEQMDLAQFAFSFWSNVRDYMSKAYGMENFKENYFHHVRRGLLEAWKKDGLLKAVVEQFDNAAKDDAAKFEIFDANGKIMPFEQFVKFALHREGGIKPTTNLAKSLKSYAQAFYHKVALDSILPKVDLFTRILSPEVQNQKTGQMMIDKRLKNFVTEYINIKRGKPFKAIIEPGGKFDTLLRAGRTITSALDLGLSPISQAASYLGEKSMNWQLLGSKDYAIGGMRRHTEQGKKILANNRAFTGETWWDSFKNTADTIGGKGMKILFAGFQDSSRKANELFLLGSMTPEEFNSGKISKERLAELRVKMGRFRAVEGAESVVGKSPEGMAWKQYKKWMVPAIMTNGRNLARFLKSIAGKTELTEQEKGELRRLGALAIVSVVGAGVVNSKNNKNDPISKLIKRTYTELISSIGAMNVASWLAGPRSVKFYYDFLANSWKIINMEKYADKKDKRLKGVEAMKRLLTPASVKLLIPEEKKKAKTLMF